MHATRGGRHSLTALGRGGAALGWTYYPRHRAMAVGEVPRCACRCRALGPTSATCSGEGDTLRENRGSLSPRKLHPLLEGVDTKNGSRTNYSFWTFAARMNQTSQKNWYLRNLLLFLSFCLPKETTILIDLNGTFYQCCSYCTSKSH